MIYYNDIDKNIIDKYYIVTEDGRIYSKYFKKYLKPTIERDGYWRLHIPVIKGSRGIKVAWHRVVATALLPNPQNKPYVGHINNIRSDNRLSNLVWCTQKENIRYCHDQNRHQDNGQKIVQKLDKNRTVVAEFESLTQASISQNCTIQVLWRSIRQRKTYKGFFWQYK